MAASDPKYIRLTKNRQRTICADTRSGFSISGKDVQPFPRDKARAKFVRRKIVAMVIEPATQAEYDEILASNARTVDMTGDDGHQEHRIYEEADHSTAPEKAKKKGKKKKGKKSASEPESDDDSGSQSGGGSDEDPEKDEEAKAAAPAKKAAPVKKAAAKKAAASKK